MCFRPVPRSFCAACSPRGNKAAREPSRPCRIDPVEEPGSHEPHIMSLAADYGDFLRGLVNDPRGVSAPTPSSPALARAIAAEVDVSRDRLVIELVPAPCRVAQPLFPPPR